MAIRSRLKALAKKMIFGSPSTSTSKPPTPPVKSSPSFQQRSVTTDATMDDAAQTNKSAPASSITTPVVSTDTPVETPEAHTPAPEQSTTDPSEASYVFDIIDLFPDTCPHCDASSNNNWIRIENQFACAACDEPFAA